MTDDDSIRLWSEVDDCSICPFHETDYCHGSPDSRQPCRDAQFPHDATCDDAYEQESGRQFAYREECEREWQLDELAEKKKKEIQAKRRSTSRLNHKINQDIHRTRRKIFATKRIINFQKSLAEAFSVASNMIDNTPIKEPAPHPLEAEVKALEAKLADLIRERKERNSSRRSND